jgi:hypothetical protein
MASFSCWSLSVVVFLKRTEAVDRYDRLRDLNPFGLGIADEQATEDATETIGAGASGKTGRE